MRAPPVAPAADAPPPAVLALAAAPLAPFGAMSGILTGSLDASILLHPLNPNTQFVAPCDQVRVARLNLACASLKDLFSEAVAKAFPGGALSLGIVVGPDRAITRVSPVPPLSPLSVHALTMFLGVVDSPEIKEPYLTFFPTVAAGRQRLYSLATDNLRTWVTAVNTTSPPLVPAALAYWFVSFFLNNVIVMPPSGTPAAIGPACVQLLNHVYCPAMAQVAEAERTREAAAATAALMEAIAAPRARGGGGGGASGGGAGGGGGGAKRKPDSRGKQREPKKRATTVKLPHCMEHPDKIYGARDCPVHGGKSTGGHARNKCFVTPTVLGGVSDSDTFKGRGCEQWKENGGDYNFPPDGKSFIMVNRGYKSE